MLKSVNTPPQKTNNAACSVIMMMMMDFSRCKKEVKNIFVTCLGLINEQDITFRACKKVEYTTSKLYENKRRA